MQRRYHGDLDALWLPPRRVRTPANEREPIARAIPLPRGSSRVAMGAFSKGCRSRAKDLSQIGPAKSYEREQNVPPAWHRDTDG
jgi:hypothetical protein